MMTLMVLNLMIMGGLMVADGLSALTLPETLHQYLPQTLEEIELFGKDFGYKQWLKGDKFNQVSNILNEIAGNFNFLLFEQNLTASVFGMINAMKLILRLC